MGDGVKGESGKEINLRSKKRIRRNITEVSFSFLYSTYDTIFVGSFPGRVHVLPLVVIPQKILMVIWNMEWILTTTTTTPPQRRFNEPRPGPSVECPFLLPLLFLLLGLAQCAFVHYLLARVPGAAAAGVWGAAAAVVMLSVISCSCLWLARNFRGTVLGVSHLACLLWLLEVESMAATRSNSMVVRCVFQWIIFWTWIVYLKKVLGKAILVSYAVFLLVS